MLIFGLLIMLELAWFSFLPGLAHLFCQLSIPQMLLVSEVLQTLGSVAAFACGSWCFQSCMAGADLPCCKCGIPRLSGFEQQEPLESSSLTELWQLCQTVQRCTTQVIRFSFYFYLHLYICLVLYPLTGSNSIKTNATVIETTWFFVHCLMP